MNYSIDWDGPGERESPPQRKHQTLEDVIADMKNCSEQYHNGLRLEPQTIGHVFDAFTYELSFYADQSSQEEMAIKTIVALIRNRAEQAGSNYHWSNKDDPHNNGQFLHLGAQTALNNLADQIEKDMLPNDPR
jgi:hypothetical protein